MREAVAPRVRGNVLEVFVGSCAEQDALDAATDESGEVVIRVRITVEPRSPERKGAKS